jgi:GMP synthase-like glutamine amidotransferase
MGGGMSANEHWHYESFAIPAGAVRVATSDACPNQTRAMGLHLAMQFHIEINETKMVNWVTDDDAKCTQAQQQYATVQDRVTMLNGIVYHMKKHQGTADRIYQKWLSHTDLAPMQ